MKKLLIVLTIWGLSQPVGAIIRHTYQQSDLFISSSAPPAIIYVSDSQGRRTGADPNLPVNSDGTQGHLPNNGLMEIPSSIVLDSSIENSDFCGWDVMIADGGAQTYTINILGVTTGDEKVLVGAELANNRALSKNTFKSFDVLVAPGQLRQVTLAFDPIQGTTSLQRVVSGGELLSDVQIACQLGLITSSRDCKSLEQKVGHIQNAFQSGSSGAEKSAVDGFLRLLIEVNVDGTIQLSAFQILQEDANALSQTIVK